MLTIGKGKSRMNRKTRPHSQTGKEGLHQKDRHTSVAVASFDHSMETAALSLLMNEYDK
jgi:hypothetical protein